MHNRQGLTLKLMWESIMDYDLWPMYLMSVTLLVPTGPVAAYLTLFLRSLGFDTFEVNLLSIPPTVLFLIQLIFWSWVSERINNRMAIVLFYSVWIFPLLMALELLPSTASAWSWYAVTVVILGYPYVHSINGQSDPYSFHHPFEFSDVGVLIVSLVSRNAGSVRTRTVGSAVYNMLAQVGGIISSNVRFLRLLTSFLKLALNSRLISRLCQIYRSDDQPFYRKGNKILLAILGWNVVMTIFVKFYYIRKNKSRERIWNAMSPEQKHDYLRTTKDEGNKRLDFRFAH